MVARYNHNFKKFDLEVLCGAFMVEEMRKRAERVKERAEAIAPDATPLGVGYKYSFEVSSGIVTRKTKRAFGRVANTDRAALMIEFGTGEGIIRRGKRKGQKHGATPAHRTLGKALDAAG